MDVLTLLTLPPDAAVHVRGCFVRCPACVLDKVRDNPEVLGRLFDDDVMLGDIISASEIRNFPRCPDCERDLFYGEVPYG